MGESATRYTAEHTAKELELEAQAYKRDLGNQIEINIILLREMREIKRTVWYKLGKVLWLIP